LQLVLIKHPALHVFVFDSQYSPTLHPSSDAQPFLQTLLATSQYSSALQSVGQSDLQLGGIPE